MSKLYTYKAMVTRVIDGDTIVADIDLGFKTILKNERIRLFGINAYETTKRGGTSDEHKKLGLECKNNLIQMIEGEQVIIQTKKDSKGKFGRWLGTVYYADVCINNWVVDNGYGIYQSY